MQMNNTNIGIIKKYCLITILITFISILFFSYFVPILAYYIAFFSGLIFILALRAAYIKIGLLNLSAIGKFFFLIVLIIPFFLAFYVFFSKIFGYFSTVASLLLGTLLFYIILGFYTIKKYKKDLILKIILYSILIPSLIPYFTYFIENGSGLYPMFGLISMFIWQISTTLILSQEELYFQN